MDIVSYEIKSTSTSRSRPPGSNSLLDLLLLVSDDVYRPVELVQLKRIVTIDTHLLDHRSWHWRFAAGANARWRHQRDECPFDRELDVPRFRPLHGYLRHPHFSEEPLDSLVTDCPRRVRRTRIDQGAFRARVSVYADCHLSSRAADCRVVALFRHCRLVADGPARTCHGDHRPPL